MAKQVHPFESVLSVSTENIDLEFRDFPHLLWADFILTPPPTSRQRFSHALVPGGIPPYIRFDGGKLKLSEAALTMLNTLALKH